MATREQLIEDFADHKYATGEKFARLINSMKLVQEPVESPAESGTSNSFIDRISQGADGKITATKKRVVLNYVQIQDKPTINGVTLMGDQTAAQLGLATANQVEVVSNKVDKLPSGYYYGKFNSVEDLPEATEKGYAYIASSDPTVFYTYLVSGAGAEWVDSGNKMVNTVDLTTPKTAGTELSKEEKYYASANVSDRPAVVVIETGVVRSLGYRVLNPNLSFAEQVHSANTIYEIKDSFDLDSGSISIPQNCKLKINGGKIDNGTLVLDDTQIECTDGWIGENLVISGKPNATVYPDWFSDAEDADKIEKAIKYFSSIKLYPRDYIITKPIIVSTSFKIEGCDFGNSTPGPYAGNPTKPISTLLVNEENEDIPCIMRICQKVAGLVSADINGVSFVGKNKIVDGIRWSTPGYPSYNVNITNCTFSRLNRGIYPYIGYTYKPVTFGIGSATFKLKATGQTNAVNTVKVQTGASSDNYSATASVSGRILTIIINPKNTFSDTISGIKELQDVFDATEITGTTEIETIYLGNYVTVLDLYDIIKPNIASETITKRETNIEHLNIKNCSIKGNNWGLYVVGDTNLLNTFFGWNNADSNTYGAVYTEPGSVIWSIIVTHNTLQSEPTPIEIGYDRCYVDVSCNYFESKSEQKCILRQSLNYAGSYKSVLKIYGNYVTPNANYVIWDIDGNLYDKDHTFVFDNVGMNYISAGLPTVMISNGLEIPKNITGRLKLNKAIADSKVNNLITSTDYIRLFSTSNAALDSVVDGFPMAFKKISGISGTTTVRVFDWSSFKLKSGVWRLFFFYKCNVQTAFKVSTSATDSTAYPVKNIFYYEQLPITDTIKLLYKDIYLDRDAISTENPNGVGVVSSINLPTGGDFYISNIGIYKLDTTTPVIDAAGNVSYTVNEEGLKCFDFQKELPIRKNLTEIPKGYQLVDSSNYKIYRFDGYVWRNAMGEYDVDLSGTSDAADRVSVMKYAYVYRITGSPNVDLYYNGNLWCYVSDNTGYKDGEGDTANRPTNITYNGYQYWNTETSKWNISSYDSNTSTLTWHDDNGNAVN